MKRWQLTTAIWVLAAASGCNAGFLRTANQDLERENFQLEQRLDAVTWELQDARAALEACRCASGAPGGAISGPPATFSSPRRGQSAPLGAPPPAGPPDRDGDHTPGVDRPPDVQLPFEESRRGRRGDPVPRYSGPPTISPPDPNIPDGIGRARPRTSPPAATGDDRHNLDVAPTFVGLNAATDVSELTINPSLTVWRKSGANGSDGGLRVVAEPRDASGNTLNARGDLAIVVLDPTKAGSAARIARWDFSAEDLPRHFKGTKAGGGLHFSLSWPGPAPTADDLLLFVRLTTADGQQFVGEDVLRPHTGPEPASWTEAVADDDPPSSAQEPRSAVRWRRAATPLDARQPPRRAEATVPQADPAEATGPTPDGGPAFGNSSANTPWAPYR